MVFGLKRRAALVCLFGLHFQFLPKVQMSTLKDDRGRMWLFWFHVGSSRLITGSDSARRRGGSKCRIAPFFFFKRSRVPPRSPITRRLPSSTNTPLSVKFTSGNPSGVKGLRRSWSSGTDFKDVSKGGKQKSTEECE